MMNSFIFFFLFLLRKQEISTQKNEPNHYVKLFTKNKLAITQIRYLAFRLHFGTFQACSCDRLPLA
jgi:hypothetical protein